jgi:hypothetical protein
MLIKWLPDYTSLFSDRNIRKKRKARIYHYRLKSGFRNYYWFFGWSKPKAPTKK